MALPDERAVGATSSRRSLVEEAKEHGLGEE
jgi:hypothetical protein